MQPLAIFRFILLGLSWGVMLAACPHAAAAQQAEGGAPAPPAQQTEGGTPAPPAQQEEGGAPAPPAQAKTAMDYFKSGGTHLDKGNLDQAIADYTEAIRLKPDFFLAYLIRGTARRKKGEVDLAIADFTKAIQLKPDLYDAYTLRGICYGKQGRYEEAIADFTKALEKKPHYLTYHGLAWIFATSKNQKYRNGTRALELAQKAVQISRNPSSLDTLAAAYAEAGRFKEAVETQEEALDLLRKPGPVPKKDLAPYDRHLQAYKSNKPWRE